MLLNCGVGESSESPLDCKEIKPINLKGNQSWIFIRRADAEAETPTLWPRDGKSWLIGKDPDAWKDWRQEKGMTEDEMVGWHHQLNGHDCEQTPGDSEEQGSLACWSPWDHKESDRTEWTGHQGDKSWLEAWILSPNFWSSKWRVRLEVELTTNDLWFNHACLCIGTPQT